ncbi:alpha-amylase family protein [Legionella sp. W05-934-2]|uniref:alpha-amylase family protein n=1 Tax=Legionella sp. W05-934-2 TaxID=1198649 RepID=UPI003461B7C9
MSYHFLTDGNGIISCYDMYPTQFRSFVDMTNYLPTLKEMGFNALWINPLQLPGDISDFYKSDKNNGVKLDNEVTKSLYGMSDPHTFNPRFCLNPAKDSKEDAQQLNAKALQTFTSTARKFDIVPMFDLVLNHIAIDSPICQERPNWVKGIHRDFKDVRGFNYDDENIRNEIIDEFWKPYIYQYMVIYGFDGVRVDAVGYVHPEVRRALYEYIDTLAKEHGKPKPVILDESLFCKRPLHEEVEYLKLPAIGPTHITTEVFNADIDRRTSGLPTKIKQDELAKASVVFQQKNGIFRTDAKGGCINFCGNHDFHSLAMAILFQMATSRLKSDNAYLNMLALDQLSGVKSVEEVPEPLKTTLLFSYADEIQREIEEKKQETLSDFKTLVFEKLALTALTGSGGWFVLSGDETSDVTDKTVFQRRGAVDESYYPQRTHHIFSDNRALADIALEKMAKDNFMRENANKEWMLALYNDLNSVPEMQKRLLVAHKDNIRHQINAGIRGVQQIFAELLDTFGIKITFEAKDFIAKPRTYENGWLGLQDNSAFIKQLNTLLKQLPASLRGYSSDLVRLDDKPDLMVFVRKNGTDIQAAVDVVIVNLNPANKVILTPENMQLIAKQYCNQYLSLEMNESHEQNEGWKSLYEQVMLAMSSNHLHLGEGVVFESFKQLKTKGPQGGSFFFENISKDPCSGSDIATMQVK